MWKDHVHAEAVAAVEQRLARRVALRGRRDARVAPLAAVGVVRHLLVERAHVGGAAVDAFVTRHASAKTVGIAGAAGARGGRCPGELANTANFE